MMRLKWWQFAVVMTVSIGFLVVLFVVAEFGRLRLVAAAADVRRAKTQLTRVVDLYQILMNAESGHRGYLLTGDPRHLEPALNAEERIDTLSQPAGGDVPGTGRKGRCGTAAPWHRRPRADGPDGDVDRVVPAARPVPQALLDRSLTNWDRELQVVGRLNLATLLVGLVLAAVAVTAMARGARQRADAAAELVRQHDELKAQAAAQAAELAELYRHLQHVQEEERARLSRGLHDELGGVLLAALRWQVEETCKRANISCKGHFPDDEPQFSRTGAITLFQSRAGSPG